MMIRVYLASVFVWCIIIYCFLYMTWDKIVENGWTKGVKPMRCGWFTALFCMAAIPILRILFIFEAVNMYYTKKEPQPHAEAFEAFPDRKAARILHDWFSACYGDRKAACGYRFDGTTGTLEVYTNRPGILCGNHGNLYNVYVSDIKRADQNIKAVKLYEIYTP